MNVVPGASAVSILFVLLRNLAGDQDRLTTEAPSSRGWNSSSRTAHVTGVRWVVSSEVRRSADRNLYGQSSASNDLLCRRPSRRFTQET
jgi:hypothetical protein